MADSPTRNLFASSVVLRLPGARTVDVTRDRPWGGAGRLFDLYRPPDARGPLEGSTEVADQGRQFKFAVPDVTADEIPAAVPLLIARAGADATPGVNASIDRFARYAETRPLDVEIAEHPTGPHAFDVLEESDTSRAVIRRVVDFLRDRLLA